MRLGLAWTVIGESLGTSLGFGMDCDTGESGNEAGFWHGL